MTQSILVRPAIPSDVDRLFASLLGIARHVGEAHKVTSMPADLEKTMFAPRPALEGVVAEVDRQYAGMCLFFQSFSTWRGKPGVYVQDLWVEPAHRRQRVGERLLQHVAALTRTRGGVYMRLSVDRTNERAIGFYEGMGLVLSAGEQVHAAYDDAFRKLADGATK